MLLLRRPSSTFALCPALVQGLGCFWVSDTRELSWAKVAQADIYPAGRHRTLSQGIAIVPSAVSPDWHECLPQPSSDSHWVRPCKGNAGSNKGRPPGRWHRAEALFLNHRVEPFFAPGLRRQLASHLFADCSLRLGRGQHRWAVPKPLRTPSQPLPHPRSILALRSTPKQSALFVAGVNLHAATAPGRPLVACRPPGSERAACPW